MRVLDLFCGMGGWSKAFADRGHEVITVDINKKFNPTICADIMTLNTDDFHKYGNFDIILASPPCTEFTKTTLPQSFISVKKYGCNPDTKILEHTIKLIRALNPRWYIIENVRGAVKYFEPLLGKYTKKVGSRYLWGEFPLFYAEPTYGKWKIPPSENRAALRSLIPYNLSLAVCLACEREIKEMI